MKKFFLTTMYSDREGMVLDFDTVKKFGMLQGSFIEDNEDGTYVWQMEPGKKAQTKLEDNNLVIEKMKFPFQVLNESQVQVMIEEGGYAVYTEESQIEVLGPVPPAGVAELNAKMAEEEAKKAAEEAARIEAERTTTPETFTVYGLVTGDWEKQEVTLNADVKKDTIAIYGQGVGDEDTKHLIVTTIEGLGDGVWQQSYMEGAFDFEFGDIKAEASRSDDKTMLYFKVGDRNYHCLADGKKPSYLTKQQFIKDYQMTEEDAKIIAENLKKLDEMYKEHPERFE